MQKIGFVGVYDKTDLLLCVAKVLTIVGKKVCILDASTTQKCKYVVPVINPTKSYITEFDGIDVAIGFKNIEELKQYLGLENDETLEVPKQESISLPVINTNEGTSIITIGTIDAPSKIEIEY